MVCYKMCALASDQGWLRHCVVVAIFKLLLNNNLVGHKTKLVGPVPHLGYATGVCVCLSVCLCVSVYVSAYLCVYVCTYMCVCVVGG